MTISVTKTARSSHEEQFVNTTEMLRDLTQSLERPALDKTAIYKGIKL